jgi:glutathione peroxidase
MKMSVYDFTVKNNNGEAVSLSAYAGKALLIVNTATQCGLTPQYGPLEELYKKYKERGLEVLDFPCNQFKEQAPGSDAEIQSFCELNFGTTFPRFSKVDVNGADADPLFVYLKEQVTETDNAASAAFKERVGAFTPYNGEKDIKWNFSKFLVDRAGTVVAWFSPTFTPEELGGNIEELL